jgi:hypothetical protein
VVIATTTAHRRQKLSFATKSAFFWRFQLSSILIWYFNISVLFESTLFSISKPFFRNGKYVFSSYETLSFPNRKTSNITEHNTKNYIRRKLMVTGNETRARTDNFRFVKEKVKSHLLTNKLSYNSFSFMNQYTINDCIYPYELDEFGLLYEKKD